MKPWLKKALSVLGDVLYPRGFQCLVCEELASGGLLCRDCQRELNALRLPDEEEEDRSIWRYEGCARSLVLGLKHRRLADCATVLAGEMAASLRRMHLPEDTLLTWVTMPEKRRRVRGIDHGRVLCEAVAAETGFTARQLLVRRGDVHTQQGLGRAARLRNLSTNIGCDQMIATPVVLIDDVMTTGATASACREALLRQGATAVYVLTATRA